MDELQRRSLWDILEGKSDGDLVFMAATAMSNAAALDRFSENMGDGERRLAAEINSLVTAQRPHLVAIVAAALH